MSEQRRPKTILNRLKAIMGKEIQIDYHLFRGMVNQNTICYIISLLQLLFHSTDFIRYIDSVSKIKDDEIENNTDLLLKNIYNDLYLGETKAIKISDFFTNWKGWGDQNAGFPAGFQDVLEFLIHFTNTFSDDLKKLFQISLIERDMFSYTYESFVVDITSTNLRECIANAEDEIVSISNCPPLLLIQLNRAKENEVIVNDFVAVNKTIIFNGAFYTFVGAVIYEAYRHYHSYINICDEGFDFNDNEVSPLFLDSYSRYPSSYNRCLDAESKIHRNAVLFLYEHTDHDDLSIIHYSPNMHNMMSNNDEKSNVIQIHERNEECDEKYIEVPNYDLTRDEINLSRIESNDLKGVVKINSKGIPPNVIEPIKDNRFMKNRRIFKWVANIMRDLKEFNQGKLNAELLLHKLDFESDERDFIQVQGCILYDIMKNVLLEKNDLSFNDVIKELQPIIDSYEAKYKNLLRNKKVKTKLFTTRDDCFIDDKNDNNEEEEEEAKESIDFSFFDEAKVISNDDDFDSDYNSSEYSSNEVKLKYGEGELLAENDNFRMYKTTTDSFENLSLDYANDMINPEDDECPNNNDDDNQFSLIDYHWQERAEVLDACEILKEIRNKIQEKYNKRKKISLDSKSEIKDSIRYEVLRNWENSKSTGNTMITFFARKWIKENVNCKIKNVLVVAYNDIIESENIRKIRSAEKLLEQMRSEDEEVNRLIDLEEKKEKERKEKNEEEEEKNEEEESKKDEKYKSEIDETYNRLNYLYELLKKLGKNINYYKPNKKYSLSTNSIKHWIEKYERSEEEQNKIKKELVLKEKSKWGGAHNLKLNDDVLLCIICLTLDFPNMPSKQIASYLNSKYGPCSDEKKHIKPGTVSRALRSLNFSMKKVAFCPTTRNSIGLRIYRVAWSLLMQEISNQNDVLIGFIDEAAVSIGEGKKYGRSFVGITPLINSPLSHCKISVLSCVLPGYGVLYKFFSSAVHGSDYACFLKDITQFIRTYICSSNMQILFIEDNCKIHCTEEVEDIINKLKIALIPTVPYSPALNGVVEGYFGFIKLAHLEFYSDTCSNEPTCDEMEIRETWERISTLKFNDEIANSLYAEWKARMALCIQGIPLVSGHIKINGFEKDAERLLSVKVFRHYREVDYN